MHAEIRNMLGESFNGDFADSVRILYGGSTKPANAAELFAQPDVDRFAYFVNYIVYPIDRKGGSPLVTGYFDTAQASKPAPHLSGNKVMVYVPENDPETDNVYIVTEVNGTYKFDFGGKVSKLAENEQDFQVPSVELSNYSHYIDIHPGPESKRSEGKPWWKFW